MAEQLLLWHRFSAPTVLHVSGKDARRYLNARLTQDIKSLQPASGCQAAALSPQGKVDAIVSLRCLEQDSFLLWSQAGDKNEIMQAIKRFIVADRVAVSDVSTQYALIHLSASEARLIEIVGKLPPDCQRLRLRRLAHLGADVLVPTNEQEAAVALLSEHAPELTETQWHYQRSARGLPSYPDEVSSDLLLAETQIPDLVSYTKGCYAGQEVVERLSARGKLARQLVRYHCSSAPLQGFAQQEKCLLVIQDKDRERDAGWLLTHYAELDNGCQEQPLRGFALVRSAFIPVLSELRVTVAAKHYQLALAEI
jgi:folate-binding protein YgfZ